MWETWVRSLGQKGPLGKEIATHSNSLAWKIPCAGARVRNSAHGKGHEEGGLAYAKA